MNDERRARLKTCLRTLTKREREHLDGAPSRFAELNEYDEARGAFFSPFPSFGGHIGVVTNTRFVDVPAHYHDYLEMAYLYSGHCNETINGREVELFPGDLVMVDTNTVHSIAATGEEDILLNFIMDEEFFTQNLAMRLWEDSLLSSFVIHALDSTSQKASYLVFSTAGHDRFEVFLRELLYATLVEDWEDERLSSLFLLCMAELEPLLDVERSVRDMSKTSALVTRTLQYLGGHFLETSLEETARAVHVNPSYLTTILKRETGASYKQLVTELRMSEAQRRLSRTDEPVESIALSCGYDSAASFHRAFKAQAGCTPAAWRKGQRAGARAV